MVMTQNDRKKFFLCFAWFLSCYAASVWGSFKPPEETEPPSVQG